MRHASMRWFGPLLFLLSLVATSRLAYGQTADAPTSAPRPITLAEAIAYARVHQPAIRAALARVAAKAEEAKIPSGQWLPLVGATAQLLGATANNTTASYVTPSFMDIPRIGATRPTSAGSLMPYPSTFVGAGISQEIFDFGRIAAQRAAGDALVDVAKQSATAQRLDVDLAVEEAYYAVFAATGVLAASEDAYERAKAHRDLAKAGAASGLRPPIELTRAQADLAHFDVGRVRARGGLAVAQSVLAAAVGAPDAALDVAGEAPEPAAVPPLATAMREAAARDPRILQVLAQLKAEEERTRAIGAELRPDVSLTGTVSARAGGAPSTGDQATAGGWAPYVPNWDVGLVISWPIFDGVVTARQDASRTRQNVWRDELDAARLQQVADIRNAYVAFDVAHTVLPELRGAVEAAKANYAQADARFRAGMGTSVELADAEALRADADIQLALGSFEVARTRAAFGRAIAEGL